MHNVVLTSNITGQINAVENTVEIIQYQPMQHLLTIGVPTGGTLQSVKYKCSRCTLGYSKDKVTYVIETDANGCVGDTISLMVTITQQPSNIQRTTRR